MRLTIFALILAAAPAGVVRAAETCPKGDKAFEALQGELSRASTCQAAAARLHHCAWGSSADNALAGSVIDVCEKTFVSRLPVPDRQDYKRQMQRCAYAYAGNGGTLAVSEAALCQVDVAAAFARNPKAALRPAHASFDCAKARSPVERLVCADDRLGDADIILSQDYRVTLKGAAAADRPAIVASQRRWLAALPVRCRVGPQPTSAATACVTRAYEARFAAFNDCGVTSDAGACLAGLRDAESAAPATTSAGS